MLGLNRAPAWRFFAAGKHPCARDFIHVGVQTPLSGSLADWMVRGFRAEKAERGVSAASIVWRFWLRGGPGEIVCGLLKESSDSIGRPFPLLLVGGGRLPEREGPWQELPLILSGLWQQMEELSAPETSDLGCLERGLETLLPPQGGEPSGMETGAPSVFSPPRLHDGGFILLKLHQQMSGAACEEELRVAGKFLTEHVSRPPIGAFIGGESGAPRYGVLTRPLRTADFATLWSRGF